MYIYTYSPLVGVYPAPMFFIIIIIIIEQAMAKLANEELTPNALRDMSDSVLVLVTTTIEHMEPVCSL